MEPAKAISIVVALARVLSAQPDLRALHTDTVPCGDGLREPTTIEAVLDDGSRLLCSGPAPLRCVDPPAPGKDPRASTSCDPEFSKRAKPAPAWLAPLGAGFESFDLYAPREPGLPTIVARDDDRQVYVAVRGTGGWRVTEQPLGEGQFWDDLRVLDTSALTGGPSFGVVVSLHDGGTLMGAARTELVILAEEDGKLRKKDGRLVGLFQWSMSGRERNHCAACRHSYDARPHVELRLEPKVTGPGALRLTLKVNNLKRLAHVCNVRDLSPLPEPKDGEEEPTLCQIDELREVRHNAGTWRWVNGRLAR
jgi:hypothetical protein